MSDTAGAIFEGTKDEIDALRSILAKLRTNEPFVVTDAEMRAHIEYMRQRGRISCFEAP